MDTNNAQANQPQQDDVFQGCGCGGQGCGCGGHTDVSAEKCDCERDHAIERDNSDCLCENPNCGCSAKKSEAAN